MFRQFFSLGALSALLAVAATDSAETYTEIIDGYKFISSGPKHLASKAEYEVATHKTAVELLKERLGEDGLAALLQPDVNGSEPIWNAVFAANSTATPDGWLMTEGDVQAVAALPDLNGTAPAYDHETLKTAVALAKEHIGEEKLMSLLQPDILAADAIWHEVIANSTPGSWVPADGCAVCLLPNVTALGFALWSASPLCDAANNAANAEHYVKRTVEIGVGRLASEILEGWGGVTTLFAIPVYSTHPDRATHPFLHTLPEFPYQGATGPARCLACCTSRSAMSMARTMARRERHRDLWRRFGTATGRMMSFWKRSASICDELSTRPPGPEDISSGTLIIQLFTPKA
ncbi:hypothetical protein B0H13DRAFT_2285413 [Mycena leptocephala]|nr:hypothetical protein B0H13DRAFT_2285413 [Mycena leptocephala]